MPTFTAAPASPAAPCSPTPRSNHRGNACSKPITAEPMLIDVHTHLVPNPLPAFGNRKGGDRWPTMVPVNEHKCNVVIAGKNFRTVTDQSWSPARRVEDMQKEGVDRQVVSPMPELFSYWFDGP